jgi:rare lipoprotein A
MYQMTAAHKTLPLPTYVRVRNLANNKTITVRVNDRGPFVNNRIIDLSYAAAMKLDMLRDGTGLVEVIAINFDAPAGDRPTRQIVPPTAPPQPAQAAQAAPASDTAAETAETSGSTAEGEIYVQVGAFGEHSNAERRRALLQSANIYNAFIYEDRSGGDVLHRVRIGPVKDVVQYDVLVEELEAIGITDPYLIID